MCEMSTIFNFPLEQRCEECTFLDQGVEDFELSLDSVFMNAIEMSDLHALCKGSDVAASSVYIGFLCSVSTNTEEF